MPIGGFEIVIVLFIILLLVGPRRITGLGRAVGRGIRDFKDEFNNGKRDKELSEDKKSSDNPDKKA